jgi:uncharacterized lipoprotein YddW (UPF0748 family)
MKYKFVLLLVLNLFFMKVSGLEKPNKREFRGVWVATVTNIDWPSTKRLSTAAQKEEFVALIDEHRLNGFNTVIVQIRPSADAFYASELEPWSEWLTGTQGQAPAPYYDPLAFMIETCHERGIEFHAWINPFRAVLSAYSQVSADHITKQKPEWVVKYGSLQWLDPGIPEVRDYIQTVIADIITRYDVDGIHFDDYFYPYPVKGNTFNDETSFKANNASQYDKGTWRRENINAFVQSTAATITACNSNVKFGISPFGIWRNKDLDKNGSATQGLSSYDDLYADSRKWIEKGWIDYMSPQIYWSHNHAPAKYGTLTQWWSDNAYDRHVYVGHAANKVNNNKDVSWNNPAEIPNQVRLNRSMENIQGSVFYNSNSVNKNPAHLRDSLRKNLFNHKVLLPVMSWKDSIRPERPRQFKEIQHLGWNEISWTQPKNAADHDQPSFYTVYRFKETESINLSTPGKILAILPFHQLWYVDSVKVNGEKYKYVVTALDRFHNESHIPLKLHTQPLIAPIVDVVLSPSTALINRSAPVKLETGITQIILNNLSPHIIPKSIQVSDNYDFTVREIKYELKRESSVPLKIELQAYRDSIEYYSHRMIHIDDSIKVLELMKGVMLDNQKLEDVKNLNDVKSLIEFYNKTLFGTQNKIRDLTREKLTVNKDMLLIEQQISELEQRKAVGYGQLTIDVTTEEVRAVNFKIAYLVSEVSWAPEFDLKINFDSTYCTLSSKASVRQSTGSDWEEINLSLSTSAPSSQILKGPSSPKTDTIALGGMPFEEMQTRVILDLGVRTLSSGGQPSQFNRNQKEIPLQLVYNIDASTGQKASVAGLIANKKNNNLIAGNVNLFEGASYYDTTNLTIDPLDDTLEIQLGTALDVVYKKEQLTPEDKRFLGVGNHTRAYEISVKNVKSVPVRIKLKDKIPVSKGAGFKIKPSVGRALHNPASGELEWELYLKPNEKSVIKYSYKAVVLFNKKAEIE